jgi:hypothetical protein
MERMEREDEKDSFIARRRLVSLYRGSSCTKLGGRICKDRLSPE